MTERLRSYALKVHLGPSKSPPPFDQMTVETPYSHLALGILQQHATTGAMEEMMLEVERSRMAKEDTAHHERMIDNYGWLEQENDLLGIQIRYSRQIRVDLEADLHKARQNTEWVRKSIWNHYLKEQEKLKDEKRSHAATKATFARFKRRTAQN